MYTALKKQIKDDIFIKLIWKTGGQRMAVTDKTAVWAAIEARKDDFTRASDNIWAYHEMAFQEKKAAAELTGMLEKEGFSVEKGLAGIETAFKGTWGSGAPVIGILGEYDALSGLNQKAGTAKKEPEEPGAPGQGCGHNLLGAGALAAAFGVKKYLQETGKSGTVIYFGCPGEEGGSGKAFMAKAGEFDMLDACVTWHPSIMNYVCTGTSLANVQVAYKFYGKAAHAGAKPHLGRSALDAVELMNTGVQYLREHIIQEARIHYAVTDTGGRSPNVVQAYAEVLYLIRAPKNSQVEEIYERVNKIARGAALMTETDVEIDFYKACSNIVMNRVVAKALYDNMLIAGAPEATAEEKAFAAEINATAADSAEGLEAYAAKSPRRMKAEILAHKGEEIYSFIAPYDEEGIPGYGSTDVGDASWVCPTAQIYAATWASGTTGHSWQAVAQGKSGPAHRGMLYAAKVLSGTVIDMLDNPAIIEEAKREMEETLGGEKYRSLIPDGCRPRCF